MRAPAFWWRPAGLSATVLSPIAAIYGRIAAERMGRPAVAVVPVPVICVGNLVAGGAGKTPTVQALVDAARAAGEARPMVLSRGYGGRLAGPLVVDPSRHSAADVGDEPLMLASGGIAVVVARDRPAGAALAVAHGATIVIMDDGFQNPSLYKDLVVLVVDRERGIGNGCCLPAGPLRAPLEKQLERADCLVISGQGAAADAVLSAAAGRRLPVIAARLTPSDNGTALRGQRVLAFAGIANPDKFFASLVEIGCEVVETRQFDDHHAFTEADCAEILAACAAGGLLPVTTAKDRVRLAAGGAHREKLAKQARVHSVHLVADDPRTFGDLIGRARAAAAERLARGGLA
jgi:tetraacyldisaccharide 4'-kinase